MTSDEFKNYVVGSGDGLFLRISGFGSTPEFGPSGIWTYSVIRLIPKFRHIPEF